MHIKEEDQDAIRFHWLVDKDPNQIETYRFTRALFGLVQSAFILEGKLTVHLGGCKERYPIEVDEILKSLYVNDVISDGNSIPELEQLKTAMIKIFGEANFKLNKLHSNMNELEDNDAEDGLTHAKLQLGVRQNEIKIFGVLWSKATDQIAVTFPHLNVEPTKRGILEKLASCYNPVGLAAPILLIGKSIYRNCCELGVSSDQPLPESYQKKWINWETSLPPTITVPRAFQLQQEQIEAINLHVFGDASISGTAAAAVYAVIYQSSQVSQGLVAAKARLSKKDLTIPRLKLVVMHMAANFCQNLKSALEGKSI